MGSHRRAWLAVTALGALAGCFDPQPPQGLPCTDDHRCPDGQTCDLATNVCGAPTTGATWRDDTAADFAQPGAALVDAVIEAPGAIGPAPYLTGAWRSVGIAGARFASVDAASWAALAGAPTAGTGFLHVAGFDVWTDPPRGVDLAAADDVTVAFEGEIYLEAGSWRFALYADDVGFVELDDGAGFTRLVAATEADSGVGQRAIAADGWYPIRGAVADADGPLEIYLQAGGPEANTDPRWIPPERMRTSVADLTGLVVDGFDDPYTHYPTASELRAAPLGAMTFDNDLAVGEGSWSLRYGGQVRVDVGGTYAFRLDSVDGHRLWIDGALLLDELGWSASATTTEGVALDAGWHDVVVEVMWSDQVPPKLALTVAAGPELVGQGFPVDRTRPVVGRGVRWTNAACWYVSAPDQGNVSCDAWIELPPGATPLAAGAAFEIDHPVLASVAVDLTTPDDATRALVAAGDLTGAGTDGWHVDVGLGHGAAGRWALRLTDATADMMTGDLNSLDVTVDYRGGAAPFPTLARYTSAVKDLGDVAALGALRWSVRQGAADAVRAQLRTCATADGCAAEPWTDVAPGATPTAPPRRFAQYQLELRGDGDVPTALDWIELAYLVR